MRLVLILASLVFVMGAAPPPDSEQYQMLAPYKGFIQSLQDRSGSGCCNLSDCRAVEYRTRNGGYEALITKKDFGSQAPDAFVSVPEEVLTRRENPTGYAIACWAAYYKVNGGFFCFTPEGAV